MPAREWHETPSKFPATAAVHLLLSDGYPSGAHRTVERVGGTRSINANVRVITESKKDLTKMVAEGNFRGCATSSRT